MKLKFIVIFCLITFTSANSVKRLIKPFRIMKRDVLGRRYFQ